MKNLKPNTTGIEIAQKIDFYELTRNGKEWEQTDVNIGEKLLSRSWKWLYIYNDDGSFKGIGLYKKPIY